MRTNFIHSLTIIAIGAMTVGACDEETMGDVGLPPTETADDSVGERTERGSDDPRIVVDPGLGTLGRGAELEADFDEHEDNGTEHDEITDLAEGPGKQTAARVNESLTSNPAVAGVRSCTKNNDCHQSCDCVQGQCKPDGFGPPPPINVCEQAPVRSCASGDDCQAGCSCISGICKMSEFGPPSPVPLSCHMPPPDAYEYDDAWQSWKAYLGSPQAHNFHHVADTDWVAVYFSGAGSVQIRTQELTWGTDTRIEVYKIANGSKGALVATHDDVGGAWWVSDSKSSRINMAVAAKSSYLVRVVNKSAASVYNDEFEYPSYVLKIAYN